MCRVLFGSWLALRMPLQCPFSKPSGAESEIFKTESGPELYIYIYVYINLKHTHKYIYIYSLMKLCFRVHCSRVSVYICMFIFSYRTYTKYSTGSTKSSVQRPSRILKHRSPTKRKPTLWRIRLITSDGHFLFLPRICRHRKDTRHRKHTLYIITHKNIRFLPTYVLQYADEDLYFFQRPCLKEPTKQDDEIQDVSEVCGLGSIFIDCSDPVYVQCFHWYPANT